MAHHYNVGWFQFLLCAFLGASSLHFNQLLYTNVVPNIKKL